MLLPYSTDAPLYYFPYASIGLIGVNVLVFAATLGAAESDVMPYILQYGHGLHPVQWVTSNFLHAGFFHLLGNMFGLWTFGLLVEGKVGALVFVPLYLGLGFVQCGVEQAVMLGASKGGSLGASAILFGLMAIALVWSPRNDVSVFGLIGPRPVNFDAPILLFVGLMVAWEFVQAAWFKFSIGTSMLHISGAVLGFVVGVELVKADWVDCEGWDLFAVMAGEVGREKAPNKRKTKKKPRPADKD